MQMPYPNFFKSNRTSELNKNIWQQLHLDPILLILLLFLAIAGLFILYSASNQNIKLVSDQISHFILAFGAMFILAQIPPRYYYTWTPWLYGISVLLLIAVLIIGHIGKGAERWLSFGFFRFQPSELMKLALPLALAWYFHDKNLPPSMKMLALASLGLIIPVLLIAKEPDLGTAMMIMLSGIFVFLLAGLSWRLIIGIFALLAAISPLAWHFMHTYQRDRVLTFFNPERHPLGAGYHIIQSKIALGSGGVFGKGWLHASQSYLHFLPEHATDFIFSVCGEEFGFIGCIALIIIFACIITRAFFISNSAQDTFSRLLAGSLTLSFFASFFVNMGMVSGILPIVGIPLPLVSYGGTSMVTTLASFGMIMSISSHRKLIAS